MSNSNELEFCNDPLTLLVILASIPTILCEIAYAFAFLT